ncbi:penicillin-binding transpeptidase domain-containing protein [Planomonospora venezuelensis]|uniref:Peptidoglycan glycosyltransferase n=1 Tax=Planomonospora venezuelensis TaxID=1999 RepID=A0A841D6R4_PLAVE|nr:penicillin-binding transpeptidase domain-containing protein [Planomonospora venezuelensis]MBB5963136.1 peptidoglycan glycosyltransferase [Planomonospora venezuelensis]GIN00011.1 penicillin-binding protein [Planomonospora venezuelensis]
MAAPRARRINVPLRHVAAGCGMLLFALLGNVTYIQAFDAGRLKENPHNQRPLIARFDRPRGEILLRDGTVVATVAPAGRETGGRFRHRRVYPEGPLYAPVTGHLSRYGATGLERAEDAALAGTDPRIRVRSVMNGAAAGAALELTVEARAQRAAYEGLRATGRPGAAVAIDPATGAILAMASFPSYDPNLYTTFDVGALDRADARLQADPAGPLLNRAIQRNYPPGSTFKIITGAAALASGDYKPAGSVSAPAAFLLPGTSIHLRNARGSSCGNGDPPLVYAFKASCNTPFAKIGVELGQDTLREQAEAFGFNDGGLAVPMPVAESVYPEGMDAAQTAMSALGQFDDRATPLMLAMISAAVANDGSLMRPHLVREVRLGDGTVIDETEPAEYRRALDAGDAVRLAAMMAAVTRPGGTGTAAAIRGVAVAAKTGTAETAPGERDHAVFTGFAPAGSPRVAVGVVVEGGGSGGRVAAPIAKAIMRAVLR